ncbi:MAG: ABC transporter permease [Candidatus Rokubacteria bacterium]|nr:ABC transporter permease [Candidatus Rokubacteria bacterium]
MEAVLADRKTPRRARTRLTPKACALELARYGGPLLTLVLLWQAMVWWKQWPPYLLPGPLEVARTFSSLLVEGILLQHLVSSIKVLLLGSIAGMAVAIPLGFWIATWRPASIFFNPIVTVLQPIPGIAWIPLAILWFGLGRTAIGFIIFLSVFFPILLNTITGVRTINRELLRVARVMLCPLWMVVTDVIVPGALAYIITGLRIGLGYGWRALVAGEMIAATSGLGYMIFDARNYLKTDEVIVGMATIGLFWALVERVLLKPLEQRTIERWGMARAAA